MTLKEYIDQEKKELAVQMSAALMIARLRVLADNPLWEQWAYLSLHNSGMDWTHDTHKGA